MKENFLVPHQFLFISPDFFTFTLEDSIELYLIKKLASKWANNIF